MKFKINTDIKPDNSSNSEELKQFDHQEVSIEELLIWATTSGCSDLYIKEYDYPYISRFGKVVRIPCVPISRDAWMEFQDVYINNQMNDTYMTTRMLDTAVEVRIPTDNPLYGTNDEYFFRYRASFGFSENARIGTFRMIRPEQPSFKTINYPEQCKSALQEAFSHKTGIIVFTGATGSGKGLFKDTLIPTVEGLKTVADIQIGDTVFDKNGKQTKVIDKYCPNDPVNYKVIISDGSEICATAGHLWEVELLNKRNPHGDTRYYERYLNDTTFIEALKNMDKGEISLMDFIRYVVDNSSFTKQNFRNFLRTYFSEVPKNFPHEEYIDLKIILNHSTHTNAKDRVDRINDFIKVNNKTIVTNKEAKEILGSKFIQIIRKCGIVYRSTKEATVDARLLSTMILDWIENLENSLNKYRPVEVLSTQELVDMGVKNHNNRTNFAIRRPLPCKYDSVLLPIEPYFLGAWLGDGLSSGSKICGEDVEIFNRCNRDYTTSNIYAYPIKKYHNGFYNYTFNNVPLKDTNLINNKHIPNIYKIASPEDKLELLAGLIDTDGHVDKNGEIELQLINKQVIEATREIACSLGIKCSTITEKIGTYKDENGNTVKCQTVYRLILTPLIMIPLQVPKKRVRLQEKIDGINSGEISQSVKHERFYITDIKEIKGNPNDYYCLAVDSPTHVFLCTESYVPTHNTTTQVAVMNDFTRPGQVLDNKVIIGLEDPIEYTFKSTDSVKFNQKELEKDFHSYELGIKQALREHPNIILVGECRDKPVINATIEAARTGHLVSTSFHASNVGGTIARLSFHLGNDINLIYDLIINLRIIMSQKLVPSDSGYLVDTQYLIFNDDITKRILEIVQSGENISLEIEKIFSESDIIEQGLAKDWTYK